MVRMKQIELEINRSKSKKGKDYQLSSNVMQAKSQTRSKT